MKNSNCIFPFFLPRHPNGPQSTRAYLHASSAEMNKNWVYSGTQRVEGAGELLVGRMPKGSGIPRPYDILVTSLVPLQLPHSWEKGSPSILLAIHSSLPIDMGPNESHCFCLKNSFENSASCKCLAGLRLMLGCQLSIIRSWQWQLC